MIVKFEQWALPFRDAITVRYEALLRRISIQAVVPVLRFIRRGMRSAFERSPPTILRLTDDLQGNISQMKPEDTDAYNAQY